MSPFSVRRAPRATHVLLLLVCLGAAWAAPALATSAEGAPAWTDRTRELAGLLPVQEGGRIKPLDAYAGFTLLSLNHKRSCKAADGRRQDHMEWLLDVLFRPELARRSLCFLVEDAQVLDAVGMAHEAKGRRDRYTFDDLAPVRGRLTELARVYLRTESKERTQVENGVVDLWSDLEHFDALVHMFDFARLEVPVPAAPRVRALWPERSSVSLLDVAERLGDLSAFAGPADPHAGVMGAPAAPPVASDPRTLTDDGQAAAWLRGQVSTALEAAGALALIPPAATAGARAPWVSPGRVLMELALGQAPTPEQVTLVRGMVTMARAAGDPRAFERALETYHEQAVDQARTRGEYDKIPLEVRLNRLDPFYRAIYLYLLAFLVLAISWARSNRWLVRGAWVLMLSGVALHLAGIVIRSVLRERPPVSTLYDTTVFIALTGVVGCLVAERIHRRGVALALAPVLGALLLFVGQRFEELKGEDTLPQLVAVLDTNFWLALHVTCITIGYGGGLLAAAVAHVHVLGRAVGLKRDDAGFYALLTRMTYGMLGFALLFSVVGTILGGIWANESWGRFWGWDPKENGALMICLSQLAILHARMGGLLKPFGVAVATILSGCVVAFSWWGVNLLGIGLHSYGFTGGILRGLTIFYAVEAAFLAVAAVTHLTGRSYGRASG